MQIKVSFGINHPTKGYYLDQHLNLLLKDKNINVHEFMKIITDPSFKLKWEKLLSEFVDSLKLELPKEIKNQETIKSEQMVETAKKYKKDSNFYSDYYSPFLEFDSSPIRTSNQAVSDRGAQTEELRRMRDTLELLRQRAEEVSAPVFTTGSGSTRRTIQNHDITNEE